MAEFIRVTEARTGNSAERQGVGLVGHGHHAPRVARLEPRPIRSVEAPPACESDAAAAIRKQSPCPVSVFTERGSPTQRSRERGAHQARLDRDVWPRTPEPRWIRLPQRAHDEGPKKNESLTREEFRECLEQARSLGMRRFIDLGLGGHAATA